MELPIPRETEQYPTPFSSVLLSDTLQNPREDGLPTTRILVAKIFLILAVFSNRPFGHCESTDNGEEAA